MPAPILAALALAAAVSNAATVTAEPPPGWTDVTAQQNNAPGVVLVLKGPETSSFVLAKLGQVELGNRAVVRSLLLDVLANLNRKTGSNYAVASNVESQTFDNGLTAYSLRANLDGKPRLVLLVTDFGGEPMLGTLTSNVPEMILPAVLSGLRGPASTLRAGPGASIDGQLAFKLPAGLGARALNERERKLGFVFAVVGHGSELMVQKLVDDIGAAKEQPQILRGAVLGMSGVDAKTFVEPQALPTPAGPELVYASAKVAGGSEFVAGFLPWGYLGYSVLAKGPRAVDLVVQTFSTLELGSSATPKIVATSPRVPLERKSKIPFATIIGIVAIVLSAAAWKRRQAV